MKNKLLISSVIIAIVVIIIFVLKQPASQGNLGAYAAVQGFSSAASSTAILISTATAQVLATSTAGQMRSYAILSISGNAQRGNVYCKLDNDKPAILEQGIWLSTTTPTYEIGVNKGNRYYGGIQCIADVATKLVVTEYQTSN